MNRSHANGLSPLKKKIQLSVFVIMHMEKKITLHACCRKYAFFFFPHIYCIHAVYTSASPTLCCTLETAAHLGSAIVSGCDGQPHSVLSGWKHAVLPGLSSSQGVRMCEGLHDESSGNPLFFSTHHNPLTLRHPMYLCVGGSQWLSEGVNEWVKGCLMSTTVLKCYQVNLEPCFQH